MTLKLYIICNNLCYNMIILCRWGWLGFNCGSTFGI